MTTRQKTSTAEDLIGAEDLWCWGWVGIAGLACPLLHTITSQLRVATTCLRPTGFGQGRSADQ